MPRKPTGKPNGRPKKEIDKKQFENLCGLQCTITEMCCFFDVTDKTLSKWCQETYGMSFSEVFAIKRGSGQISLRRSQMRLAEKNATMAIWLGKQYLGQRDQDIADAMSKTNGVLDSILELRKDVKGDME